MYDSSPGLKKHPAVVFRCCEVGAAWTCSQGVSSLGIRHQMGKEAKNLAGGGCFVIFQKCASTKKNKSSLTNKLFNFCSCGFYLKRNKKSWNKISWITGWCSTPNQLLICSSFSREDCHPWLICSSLSTSQWKKKQMKAKNNNFKFYSRKLHEELPELTIGHGWNKKSSTWLNYIMATLRSPAKS